MVIEAYILFTICNLPKQTFKWMILEFEPILIVYNIRKNNRFYYKLRLDSKYSLDKGLRAGCERM
jgi:hypothetical protein